VKFMVFALSQTTCTYSCCRKCHKDMHTHTHTTPPKNTLLAVHYGCWDKVQCSKEKEIVSGEWDVWRRIKPMHTTFNSGWVVYLHVILGFGHYILCRDFPWHGGWKEGRARIIEAQSLPLSLILIHIAWYIVHLIQAWNMLSGWSLLIMLLVL